MVRLHLRYGSLSDIFRVCCRFFVDALGADVVNDLCGLLATLGLGEFLVQLFDLLVQVLLNLANLLLVFLFAAGSVFCTNLLTSPVLLALSTSLVLLFLECQRLLDSKGNLSFFLRLDISRVHLLL